LISLLGTWGLMISTWIMLILSLLGVCVFLPYHES
jgi:hypothetical protein